MKTIDRNGIIAECPEENAGRILRHTAAHIMAQAIRRLHPQAKFAYGPATERGFYYDVDFGEEKLSEEGLAAIEEEMRRIVKENLPIKPFVLPREDAVALKQAMTEYWREIHTREGYVEVSTPLIMMRNLWETSGHWAHYQDNMYATTIDDTMYCVKPMNCPGGVLVYRSQPHSYRDLPMRVGELGLVHRHELRGALHGLFRVRCITQDDAHIFLRREQITEEIVGVVNLIHGVYRKFGFSYSVELSTRPADSMGSDEDWEAATNGLKTALERLGMPYQINPGDGAFYGPKIDFHLEDSLGRTWQCGTIQLDFQMPLNFGLEYIDEAGERQRPIMIHRVCFGSLERFIGILTEHYAGKFPLWLAPVQVKVLPVSEKSERYGREVYDRLCAANIRCELDDRGEKIGYRIREAQLVDRVPYMVVVGPKEAETGTVSVRTRDAIQAQSVALDTFCERVRRKIKLRE